MDFSDILVHLKAGERATCSVLGKKCIYLNTDLADGRPRFYFEDVSSGSEGLLIILSAHILAEDWELVKVEEKV